MQKKNQLVSYSIAVFAFLYAGSVVRAPFYGTGSPILAYLVTGAAVMVYAYAAGAFFAGRTDLGRRGPAGVLAVTVTVLVCVAAGALTEEYIQRLGGFAVEYGKPFVLFCAAAGMLGCGVYAAFRARVCVTGLARLVFWMFGLWTAAGFFAFFTLKGAVMPDSPFADFSGVKWGALIGETAYVCLDLTLLAVVLTDRESPTVRQITPRAFLYGSFGFVLLSGLNLFKNLVLFGEEDAAAAANPDLAAIRLVPLFDLPEMSVFVGTFACAVKISVYACAVLFVLKNAFGERYSSRTACGSVYAVMAAACAGLFFARRKGALNAAVTLGVLLCLTVGALLCFVLYSVPIKRQTKT